MSGLSEGSPQYSGLVILNVVGTARISNIKNMIRTAQVARRALGMSDPDRLRMLARLTQMLRGINGLFEKSQDSALASIARPQGLVTNSEQRSSSMFKTRHNGS
jgi:hypothetical protein